MSKIFFNEEDLRSQSARFTRSFVSKLLQQKIILILLPAFVILGTVSYPVYARQLSPLTADAQEPNTRRSLLRRLRDQHPSQIKENQEIPKQKITTSQDDTCDYYIYADDYYENTRDIWFTFSSYPSTVYFSIISGCGTITPTQVTPPTLPPSYEVYTTYTPCEVEGSSVTIEADPTASVLSNQYATVCLDPRIDICSGEQYEMCVATYDAETGAPTSACMTWTVIPSNAGTVNPSSCCSVYDPLYGLYICCSTYTAGTYEGRVRVKCRIDNPYPYDDSILIYSYDQTTCRCCECCEPEDENLGTIGKVPWGYSISGNCGNGGKWVGQFTGEAGATYHFDLCPDSPGSGIADSDVDIKITDSSCNILDGEDGICNSPSYLPNDFQWNCTSNGTYYVIIAPYSSYNSHTCTGDSSDTFILEYYKYEPNKPCCQSVITSYPYTESFEDLENSDAQEYHSTDVPKNIPDAGTTTSTLVIANSGTISDLNVKLDISHSWDEDLDVYLIAPDSTRVELFTDVGGSGDNFSNTILDDEAVTVITGGSAPFTGTYQPEGNLGDLDSKSITGTWTLEATDDESLISGTLNSWSLIIETAGGGGGDWINSTDDDIDWIRHSGPTPSTGTGPSSACEGSYYMYIEASGYVNQTAILESPCFDLSSLSSPVLTFCYHMYGDSMGDLILEVSDDDCASWSPVWSLSGNQGDNWYDAVIDLSFYSGSIIKVRFVGVTGSDYTSDIAIDYITVDDVDCNNITIGTGASTWDYPMHTYYHDSRTQVIYLADEIGMPGIIEDLALDVTTVPGQTMNNWTIRMKHTGLDYYSTPSFDTNEWTTVYDENESIDSTGWWTFTFSTPFTYNGTDNLMVDFSHNNSSYTTNGYCMTSSPGGTRSAYAYSDSGFGDPPTWSGTTSPSVSGSNYVPNVQLTICGECMKGTAPEYADWENWGKPACWCYARQCRGDINGTSFFGKPVTISDLDTLKLAFNQPDPNVMAIENGICADLNHAPFFGKRVTLSDLDTFKQYFNKPEADVPECDMTDFNFWETP